MRTTPVCCVSFIVLAAWSGSSSELGAQTAADRAGELKTWREQCSDPDPDLRLAYVEAALESKDVSVARICIRKSLDSENADIRNLGLRAAIAAADRLTFAVKPTETLAKALQESKGDTRELAELERSYEMRHWRVLQSGLTIEIDEADLKDGTSKWYPVTGLAARHDHFIGQATVTGDRINWVGRINLQAPNDCIMNLVLSEGSSLTGVFKCGHLDPFPVSASLL